MKRTNSRAHSIRGSNTGRMHWADAPVEDGHRHPASITTPNTVETHIGTLKFFDGFPDNATSEKVDNNVF